jgi:hypothetical protein
MSIEMRNPSRLPRYYQITVEGKIAPSWSDWLEGMQLTSQKEAIGVQTTTLSGIIVDQTALRGLLNRLWDLNLVLCSIQQVNPSTASNIE